MSRLEIAVGDAAVRLDGVAPDFGEPEDSELVVDFEPPSLVALHVYGREIADGALTCSLGPRRAVVRMDAGLLAGILAEALRRGLPLPAAEARALKAAVAGTE